MKLVSVIVATLVLMVSASVVLPIGALAQDDPAPFMDVSAEAGIDAVHHGSWDEFKDQPDFADDYQVSGQAWGDYDNDGWQDLYVTGNLAPNTLYRNNGDGTFSVSPLSKSVSLPRTTSGGAIWADYDNDGWQDLYVLAMGANVLFHNEGGEGFAEVSATAGVNDAGKGTSATWGDYDNDGYLDLYVSNWSCYPQCDPVDHARARDRLYHNNGDGLFDDVTDLLDVNRDNTGQKPDADKTTGASFAAAFVDYDGDGDADLYIINDKLQNPIGNVLWRNDGPGCDGWCWTDASAEAGADSVVHGMGLAVGDFDNDLNVDFYFTNMVDPDVLLTSQGDGTFADDGADRGLRSIATNTVGWAPAFLDYDNDGWLDLTVNTTEFIKSNDLEGARGMLFPFPNELYHNEEGQFVNATPAEWIDDPRPSMGMATADYDQDGQIDIVSTEWNRGFTLYRNSGAAGADNHWLTLRLIGDGPINRDAIGTKVMLTTNEGNIFLQELTSGISLGAGSERALHFGLGTATTVEVEVWWPDGTSQSFSDVAVDRIWNLAYLETVSTQGQEALASPSAAVDVEAEPRVAGSPEAETTEADQAAVGRVEVESPVVEPELVQSDELFANVSASAGITATHEGSWRLFKDDFDTGYLGIGQAWGDYNNDGYPDLYVTGNLTDSVLYENDGAGKFSVSTASGDVSLPDVLTGGASWADYDNDGWRDLYVLAQGANVLFHNDGGRGFTNVAEYAGVDDAGKASTAAWGDYDKDGYLDLYVANWSCFPECDPMEFAPAQDRLFHNDGDGTFTDVTDMLEYEKLLGAGFTASFLDYDNDGDLDIYVVNDSFMNPPGLGNVLWRNDGPGCGGWCWVDAGEESGAGIVIEGMGLAVGDYDNDLDLDFYFPNMVNPSALMQNQGDGTFVNAARDAGVEVGPSAAVGWGTSFFDYDNDGWLDLILVATEFRNWDAAPPPDGMHFPHANFLFHNNGDGTFTEVTPESWTENPYRSMGVAYSDYDADGWVDFVSGDWNTDYKLFRNQGNEGEGNNWLTIRLVGNGSINKDALGARVYLMTTDGRTLMQEVKSGSSLGAGNDTALHFGLGESTVDELSVVWPNGNRIYYRGVTPNQVWTLEYPGFD